MMRALPEVVLVLFPLLMAVANGLGSLVDFNQGANTGAYQE